MNKYDELVDLVDESGNIIKIGISRSEINSYPDFYMQIVIGIIFDHNNRILVQQRAKTKMIHPGVIDHICGAVISREKPIDALTRESIEETGIKPINMKIVTQGVNKYSRFRYLIIGESNEDPGKFNSKEVDWVRFMTPDELRIKQKNGEFTFVDEFFEDTNLAINLRLNNSSS